MDYNLILTQTLSNLIPLIETLLPWILLLMFLIFLKERIIPLIGKAIKSSNRVKLNDAWLNDQELINTLQQMSPKEFEHFIAELFEGLGYDTEIVGGSYDGGVDVIARKDGAVNLIQCKKFISREVTVGAVRDFYGAMANNLAHAQGYFITTNRFTLEARKFAEDKPIELIDRFKLIHLIKVANKTDIQVESVKENTNGICPKCGGSLTRRRGKFGEFIGCTNYPRCRYTGKIDN